jgi:AraC-like DNA-binding protein
MRIGVKTVCDYRETPPPRLLAKHVACFWARSTDVREAGSPPRVLPDGCIDIVWIGDLPPSVAGPATNAVLPTLPPRSSIVGVRLHPGTAPSVLGLPANELLDKQVPLQDIWGAKQASVAAEVGGLPTVEAKLAAVESIVGGRLAASAPIDQLVVAAVAWLTRQPFATVGTLSEHSSLSERQLLRRFEAAIGYGPKTLQRILRFQRLLRLAGRATAGLADLAVTVGYADQAHMTREVTRLAGLPPTVLFAGSGSSATMSDSFKTEAASFAMLTGDLIGGRYLAGDPLA